MGVEIETEAGATVKAAVAGMDSAVGLDASSDENPGVRSASAGVGLSDTGTASAEMSDTVRPLMDWLQEHTDCVLHIHKREDSDLDRVRIRLDEVGYRPDRHSLDGYTEGPAIVLHGQGSIVTDRAEAPLPRNSYLIPLAGFKVTREGGGGIAIQTNRALYSISPDHSNRP